MKNSRIRCLIDYDQSLELKFVSTHSTVSGPECISAGKDRFDDSPFSNTLQLVLAVKVGFTNQIVSKMVEQQSKRPTS